MRNIIHEIHRRSLWQVLGIYIAVSWLVLQVVDLIIDNFGLPAWVAPFALVLLLIGLPIVLATAFVQEGVTSSSGPRPREPGATGSAPSGSTQPAVPDAARPHGAPVEPRSIGTRHRLLTWRNALVGGAAAFGLLGVLAAGYLAMRTLGIGPAGTLVAKGVLEERSSILVADFGGSDREIANTATDAFRIDLGQSSVVSVIEPTQIAEVLERMQRPADAALDLELALEVAVREGIPVVVAGDLDRAGESYVVSARLIEPQSGTVLASDRRTAAGDAEVLDAIDQLSRRLRERIGESLRDLNREEPLAAVTTGSLPALRKYSQALRAFDLSGDEDRSIALLEEAVALDSAFAMAWRKLGTILNNRFVDRARGVEALEQAFRHRDRLTERERYQVEGIYHYQVGGDVTRSITAYQNLIELDPTDDYALNNLGVMYGFLRDDARSEEFYERAIRADSSNSLSYTNAVGARFAQGRTEDARDLLARFEARFPGHPDGPSFGATLAAAVGDYAEAERRAREILRDQPGNRFLVDEATRSLATFAAIQGRIGESRDHLEATLASAEVSGAADAYLNRVADLADIEVATLGPEAALRTLDRGLARFPLEEIEPLDRPYAVLALALGRAGAAARATALLDEMDATVEPRLRGMRQHVQYDVARARVALGEGRHDAAIEAARRGDRGYCTVCALQVLAEAYDAAGRVDSAIAAYRRYVDMPWFFRAEALDQFVLARNLERLGQLYDAQGDLENAAGYYARFVELWAEADEVLQPRVRAAQTRLEEILRERG